MFPLEIVFGLIGIFYGAGIRCVPLDTGIYGEKKHGSEFLQQKLSNTISTSHFHSEIIPNQLCTCYPRYDPSLHAS